MATPKPQGPAPKKQKLSQSEEEEQKLDKVYDSLQQVQTDIDKLLQQSSEEILQVETKYNQKKKTILWKAFTSDQENPRLLETSINESP